MDEELLSGSVTESDAVQTSLAEAFLALIKEQGVQEFLYERELTCPCCGDSFAVKQLAVDGDPRLSVDVEKEAREADVDEARRLVEQIQSWSEGDIEDLPPHYKQLAKKYRST